MKRFIFSLAAVLSLSLSVPAIAATQLDAAAPQLEMKRVIDPKHLQPGDVAKIEIFKADRIMHLLDADGNVLRNYKIVLGWEPIGKKTEEGDGKTPEGSYTIDSFNENSSYNKSMRISYPNKDDVAQAKKRHVSPGGAIFIHGKPNFKGWMFWHYNKSTDWTNGCVAIDNTDINEMWKIINIGTPVTINP
ncbi:MAG: L,D-transpeptidase family protein [Micavibrio sp.]|nr:L,D-transpeptidase family protein [Micavibrio sp.]